MLEDQKRFGRSAFEIVAQDRLHRLVFALLPITFVLLASLYPIISTYESCCVSNRHLHVTIGKRTDVIYLVEIVPF